MQEADEDGLYKIVTEVNELSSEDSAVRSEVLSLDAPLLKPPLKPLDPFEPLEPLDPLLPAPPSLPELPSTVEIDRAKAVGEIPIQSRIEMAHSHTVYLLKYMEGKRTPTRSCLIL